MCGRHCLEKYTYVNFFFFQNVTLFFNVIWSEEEEDERRHAYSRALCLSVSSFCILSLSQEVDFILFSIFLCADVKLVL